MFLHYISECCEFPEEKYCIKPKWHADGAHLGPHWTPCLIRSEAGPEQLAVMTKIPEAAQLASLFCWDSYHKQPRLGDYGNIATVLIGLERTQRWRRRMDREKIAFWQGLLPGHLLAVCTVAKRVGFGWGFFPPRSLFLSICGHI